MSFKHLLILIIALLTGISPLYSGIVLRSPDKNIEVEILIREKTYYTVNYKGNRVLHASPLSITVDENQLGSLPKLIKSNIVSVNETIETVWGSRRFIEDNYNQLTLDFEGDFSIEFRAFNNGVAYRFKTNLKKQEVIVQNEEVAFRFNFGVTAWMLDSKSYETNYVQRKLDAEDIQRFNNRLEKVFLPMVVEPFENTKVLITEAGVYDYPGLFIDRGNDYENFLNGRFEKYAFSTKTGGFSNYSQLADKEAEYIAKTTGTRAYPWRLLVISDDDRTFADCDLVYQLSKPCVLKDTDWIQPGKVAWEWWHDYVVEGESFEGGVNTNTYLYHIDFAEKYGLEYILIDWRWTDKYDLSLFNPDVDIEKIIAYAASKAVRVIVWCPAHTLHRQMDQALDLFAGMGIAGVKADFFGREDQTGIKMYEDLAAATAKRKLLIDFHGSTKPTGLSRTFPNVINYEAVAGNEWNKLNQDKITPNHRIMLAFTRGLQGPMDFTPGGMRNLQSGHNLRYTLPLVHGTRCGEAALFVIYNEPLKMLCDAPSVYDREADFTHFISKIPTTWDDTKVLNAEFGKYLVEARKTGEHWYVAGLTGETPKEVTVDFSFLKPGKYNAHILKDGANANRVGTDYLMQTIEINNESKLPLNMERGGGFVIRVNEE